MKKIWSLCDKSEANAKSTVHILEKDKFVISISLLHVLYASPEIYFWSNWGILPFQRVVEGLRLPQSWCEEMRKAGISKYPI